MASVGAGSAAAQRKASRSPSVTAGRKTAAISNAKSKYSALAALRPKSAVIMK